MPLGAAQIGQFGGKIFPLERLALTEAMDTDDPPIRATDDSPFRLAGQGIRVDAAQVPLNSRGSGIPEQFRKAIRGIGQAVRRCVGIRLQGTAEFEADRQKLP